MWDERYSSDHYIYGTEPNQFLQQNVSRLGGKKILCLAEGEGRNAVWLARQGYQVSAVDASSVGQTKALKLAQQHKVSIHYEVRDLACFDLGIEQWDGIVSIFCHLPPALRKSLHQRIVHALKPGGVLLLEAYTPRQLQLGTGGPQDAAMMMDAATLEAELPGLRFDHLAEVKRDIVEGTGHTGCGAVVQVIATRR
ncbi:class I SAM-dependent methyltransferase [Thalassolituus marinus]|uniref:Methyltransferase domain-containing protein n=1 Tax=Thalassolituus marinus TaxID=671053 RepID=A0ABS7ZPN1_9GAMM|nr:class I SAM-dependent methyltransferase [Thalassolituus marinus]MCA6063579.1 methyltransferase domain-containing protein [Thalassolituus marinus]